MTGLFRPWTEPVALNNKAQQDSTVSTTTLNVNPKEAGSGGDSDSREVKYKNVKEHMRKRSEKYLQKKLKLDLERKKAEPAGNLCGNDQAKYLAGQFPNAIHPGNRDVPDFLHPSPPMILPNFCCPTEGFFGPGFDSVLSGKGTGTGDFGFKNSPELLETALSQGLAPSLVEEYARLLTEQQRQISEKNRKQRPKKFRCPHCQVGFSNNGQLKGHIRIHTGERPFKCDAESCGKSFTRNEELTRHRRIHSGLRPFPCPECGKRFGRKDHLKKHVKTHFQQRYQLVPILPSHYPYIYGF